MPVKISSKYQVIIPEGVRSALNIKAGLEVDVIAKNGVIYVIPVYSMAKLRLKFKKYCSLDKNPLRDK